MSPHISRNASRSETMPRASSESMRPNTLARKQPPPFSRVNTPPNGGITPMAMGEAKDHKDVEKDDFPAGEGGIPPSGDGDG
jgi:hypothetical protein